MSDTRNRYDESHNLQYGVVQAEVEIPYHSDESRITITEHHGTYWLSMGSLHGPGDITVEFDEVRYGDNVLWFEKEVGDGTRTTAHINWYLLDTGHYWGLVGEWFRDQLNLDEYRTGAKCPECESEILNDGMYSGCENLDCDVFFEGVPDDTWEPYKPESDPGIATDGGVAMVTCPAGICQKRVAIYDHDRMFGHLLSDHRWSFETAQSWVVENMPEDEAREAEERVLMADGGSEVAGSERRKTIVTMLFWGLGFGVLIGAIAMGVVCP